MSVLLGDIERARAAHDAQRHLDLDLEEEREVEERLPELPTLPSGSDGVDEEESHPLPSAYLLDFRDGAGQRKRYITPREFGAALRRPPGAESTRREGLLLVLRGLPQEYVNVIGESAGDIDASFVEAHAERRCYRPRGLWRGHSEFEHWEYPELVQGFDPAVLTTRQPKNDMMVSPKICSVGKSDLAAVFCRASVWMGSYTPILFLDRPIWKDPTSSLRKAQRTICVVNQGECCDAAAGTRKEGDTILSLESTIQTLSSDTVDGQRFPRNILLEEMVFDLWLELFELLAPPTHSKRGISMSSCLWQMLHSLELNEDASSYNARRRQKRGEMRFSTSEDWSTLLARVHRRSTLLSATTLSKKPTLTPSSTLITTSSARTPGGTRRVNVAGTSGGNASLPPGRTPGRSGRELLDENHRALDRISYLGGILLPLPIVSSVLSMNDAYGPDGDKFFIFWAVSLPLSVVAVMVIYADTIRKAEVWVEVASEHVGVLSPGVNTEGVDARGKGTTTSLWQRITGRAREKKDEEAQVTPQSVEDNAQPIVEKRILGTPSPATSAPLERKLDEQASDQEEGDAEEPIQFPTLFSLGPGLYAAQEDEPPEVIMESSVDGRRPRAWQRKKLGWGGAMKAIVSHRKPRYCHEHSPEDLVAHEAHQRAEEERGLRRRV